jgi:DNA recombination protein RmuC
MIETLDPVLIITAAAAAIAGLVIGYLVAHLRAQRGQLEQHNEITRLNTELQLERQSSGQKVALLEEARKQLSDSFAALSSQALKHNNEEFLRLARENLKQFQDQAKTELTQKEKSFETMVKPIREALEKTERELRQMEKERQQAFGSISEHLKQVANDHQQLRLETQSLVKALRRPEVRGQWGEMTLRRLAELAGMVEYCDFYEQEHRAGAEGAMRPDMVVRMPDSRELVVDAKTSLDAYLAAMETDDDRERAEHLKRHARKMRDRMKELASKAYWTQFKNSPDFVILFIPGEQFLSAALEQDPALLEDSLSNRVILSTPNTLIALLRAVAFGWRQQSVAENAERIRDLGEDLYKRVTTFTEHMSRMGRQLGSTVESYNKAVGSLERNVLPGARKFTELGIHAKKDVPELEPVESGVRSPSE